MGKEGVQKMKMEITYTKKKGAEVKLIAVPKRMDDIELASIIEEVIVALQNMQTDLMPSMDH